MGLLELASNNSFWRGVDYFQDGKVGDWKKIDGSHYGAKVTGSNTYDVVIDTKHPKRSTCNCPHAEGKMIICKHKVALYLTVFPDELQRVMEEAQAWEKEQEKRLEEERNEIKEYVYSLTKQQLRDALLQRMINEREMRWY